MNNKEEYECSDLASPVEKARKKKPINHGPLPSFRYIVNQLFIPVENVTRNRRLHLSVNKTDVIFRFISNYRQTVGDDILPVARLYFPKWDRKRVYMMKEHKLGKIVCDYLKLHRNAEDFKRIHNWKQLSYNHMKTSVPFSDLLVEIISRRRISRIIPDSELLNVNDVNIILDKLNSFAQDKNISKADIFQNTINRMGDSELRYFFRIVLKDDPVGSESVFLNCWHPDARRLYDLTHDLKLVFWGLDDPSSRLSSKQKQIRLMLPFTPQRCQRVRSEYSKIASYSFHDLPFLIEEKFDGERMQVHIARDSNDHNKLIFKYFTRNAMDYTSIYGANSGNEVDFTGCISHLLKSSNFHENMKNCILDGEMICYDPVLRIPLPYSCVKLSALHSLALGENRELDKEPHPMFMAFDCVYLNDTSLEDYDLSQRKSALNYVLRKPVANLFTIADYEVARSGDEIGKAMKKAISMDSEGIVLKHIQSKYVVGSISKEWIKVKPEYLEEFGENLDLVIVGKIPGAKTSYICALRDDSEERTVKEGGEHNSNEKSCKFITLCKIANGFSIEDYRYIDERTKNKWKKMDEMPQTPKVIFGKDIPDFWIDPIDSVVIEARARSIALQPKQTGYATSTTLYNAYCVRIRPDKDWKTASTLNEYDISSNRAKIHSAQTIFNGKRKRRMHVVSKKSHLLDVLNKGYTTSNSSPGKVSTLFSDYVFSVKTDCIYHQALMPISKLNMVIARYGGALARDPESVILNSSKKHLIIIAEKMTSEVKGLTDKYNIFKFKWCEDCITTGMVVSPDNSHIFISDLTLNQLCASNESTFSGNPIVALNKYTFWGVVNGLNSSRLRIPAIMKKSHLTNQELYDLHKFLMFSGMTFMLIYDTKTSNRKSIITMAIRLNGGDTTTKINCCSMIVILFDEEELVSLFKQKDHIIHKIRKVMEERGQLNTTKIPHMVKYNYIESCIKENTLVGTANYRVFLPS